MNKVLIVFFLLIAEFAYSQNSLEGFWILKDITNNNISILKKEEYFETKVEFVANDSNEFGFFASTFLGKLTISNNKLMITNFGDYRMIFSEIIPLLKAQEKNFRLMCFYKLDGNNLYLYDKTKKIKMVYTRKVD